jgi:hypothetical protein
MRIVPERYILRSWQVVHRGTEPVAAPTFGDSTEMGPALDP